MDNLPNDGAGGEPGVGTADTGARIVGVVAANIRRLRAEAGWSIGELARRAGVGKATVSNLEAGTANPSIETLVSISAAFAIPFGVLVTPPRPVVEVQRVGEGPSVASAGETFLGELLWTTGRVGEAELYRYEIRRGEPYLAAPHPVGVIETVVCCRGRVRLGPEGGPVELDEGDRATFPADRPHTYQALTGTASLVAVLTYR